MRRRIICCLLAGVGIMMTGCGEKQVTQDNPAAEVSQTPQKEDADSEVEESGKGDEVELVMEEKTAETPTVDKVVASDVLYDRTYLKEENGGYVYSMNDLEIIEKYDELYAEAFIDTSEPIELHNKQGFNTDKPFKADSLVLKNTTEAKTIRTGSFFEEDFDFAYNNLGYTYVDLNSDGVFELIFGVIKSKYPEDVPEGTFERAYTLLNGKPVKFCEVGNRDLHWLGNDGSIYHTCYGGIEYWGIEKLSFDPEKIVVDEELYCNTTGLTGEEFVGIVDFPVHVIGSISDYEEDKEILQNKFSITEDEQDQLYKELESRRVKIDWLKMSDYMAMHKASGT